MPVQCARDGCFRILCPVLETSLFRLRSQSRRCYFTGVFRASFQAFEVFAAFLYRRFTAFIGHI